MRTTFEIKHSSTRHGIVVAAANLNAHQRRAVLCTAFELAASYAVRDVTDPGFWTLMVGGACLEAGPTSVQRVFDRGDAHVVLFVERSRMLEARPSWPMVKLSDSGAFLDLRGPKALACGPSDDELAPWVAKTGEPVERLHAMFEVGVLQWSSEPAKPGHRREIVRAS